MGELLRNLTYSSWHDTMVAQGALFKSLREIRSANIKATSCAPPRWPLEFDLQPLPSVKCAAHAL